MNDLSGDVRLLELKKGRYEKAFYDLFTKRCRTFIQDAEGLLAEFRYIEGNCELELVPTSIVFSEFKNTLEKFVKEMNK